jgi:NAD(P)-dependent dehydrogenase (short-subunit alcohol dehydrogenase family)
VVGCGLTVEPSMETVDLVRASGGEMLCELTDPADCQALVEPADRTYRGIDVLFNLAATASFSWLEDITNGIGLGEARSTWCST